MSDPYAEPPMIDDIDGRRFMTAREEGEWRARTAHEDAQRGGRDNDTFKEAMKREWQSAKIRSQDPANEESAREFARGWLDYWRLASERGWM